MDGHSWTLLGILNQTSSFFGRKQLENPRLQAELLLAGVLQLRRVDLYLQFDRLLTSGEVDAYREAIRQRLQRRPVQYITGQAGFRELELDVAEGVLIPRPETEIVVDAVLELLGHQPDRCVLDLGCGSGAIAIAIASERPGIRVVAVDLADTAVRCTRRNAEAAGVAAQVQVVQGDLFAPFYQADTGLFDIIVSNPPYIPSKDIGTLEPEVRDYEPHLALDGGRDGLALYRRIIAQAGVYLTPPGHLVLELGDGMSDAVRDLIEARDGFEVSRVMPDLRRVPRVLVASQRTAGDA